MSFLMRIPAKLIMEEQKMITFTLAKIEIEIESETEIMNPQNIMEYVAQYIIKHNRYCEDQIAKLQCDINTITDEFNIRKCSTCDTFKDAHDTHKCTWCRTTKCDDCSDIECAYPNILFLCFECKSRLDDPTDCRMCTILEIFQRERTDIHRIHLSMCYGYGNLCSMCLQHFSH